jgi:polyphosphate glucokinase
MNVLVVDIGGTHVKVLASGKTESRQFESGRALLPKPMALQTQKITEDWSYDVVSIGYPGPVLRTRPIAEPHNLGSGWVGFDFESAFARPVKVINDAAMQALGGYKGGKMLFLGLGTGLGSTMIVDGIIEPMELGHLPYKKRTYEDYVGQRGLERLGKNKWRRSVADVVGRLVAALEPDDVVLGGGNARQLKELPAGCRLGDNANAFAGGFRIWERTGHGSRTTKQSGTPEPLGRRVQPVTVVRVPQESSGEPRPSNGSTRQSRILRTRKKENGIGNNDTVSQHSSAH